MIISHGLWGAFKIYSILTITIPFFKIVYMEILEFEWDDDNIEHIAKHGVLPDEIEEVAFYDEPWIKKGRSNSRYMLGYTVGGRYLFVVYVLKGHGAARVITSMDMDEKTRKLYKRRGK
jgi:uncharacterized protein